MCYSTMIERESKKMEKQYRATMQIDAFVDLYRQRNKSPTLKIPAGMDGQLISLGGSAGREIELLCKGFLMQERNRLNAKLDEDISKLGALEDQQAAKPIKSRQEKIESKKRSLQATRDRIDRLKVNTVDSDYRIYPYFFAPMILQSGAQRLIIPARFRILPRDGFELPPKYNLFNARRNELTNRKNWKPLFGKQHGLFAFKQFYEQVGPDDNRVEIVFRPDGYERMWAPTIYEETTLPDIGMIRSFAMITDEPPKEVSDAGHDRCPIFLDSDLIDDWLTPQGKSLEQLDELLSHKQPTYYSHAMVA